MYKNEQIRKKKGREKKKEKRGLESFAYIRNKHTNKQTKEEEK